MTVLYNLWRSWVKGEVDMNRAHAKALVLEIAGMKPSASMIGVILSVASFLSKSASTVCEAKIDPFFQTD